MYHYATMRTSLFSHEGLSLTLSIWNRTRVMLAKSGAVRLGEAISGSTGDSWMMLASVDWLVESGYLRELSIVAQDRVFVLGPKGLL